MQCMWQPILANFVWTCCSFSLGLYFFFGVNIFMRKIKFCNLNPSVLHTVLEINSGTRGLNIGKKTGMLFITESMNNSFHRSLLAGLG
jgi:hypothetical protein